MKVVHMPASDVNKNTPVTIKKYANRRLYNTATSSYVTLDHLSTMVKEGIDFVVFDAKTGEDITRSVLTQIIVEEENKGPHMLPISFLRQLITMYGDSMQWMVPGYLEYSMKSFAKNQERMRDYFQTTFGGMFPFGGFEEMGKQQLAMFESAMRMFSPFGALEGQPLRSADVPAQPDSPGTGAAPETNGQTLQELRDRLDDLQRQISSLSKEEQKSEGASVSEPQLGRTPPGKPSGGSH